MHIIENLDRNDFEGDVILSNDQAARLIGIGSRTLHRMRAVGAGPSYRKVAGHVLYPLADVQAYIKAATVPAKGFGSRSNFGGTASQAA
jgi:Helix-turn-helix domain